LQKELLCSIVSVLKRNKPKQAGGNRMFKIENNIVARVVKNNNGGNAYINIEVATKEAFNFACEVNHEVAKKDSFSYEKFDDRVNNGFPVEATIFCSNCYDMDEVCKTLNEWKPSK
jgi:hypothetical protein